VDPLVINRQRSHRVAPRALGDFLRRLERELPAPRAGELTVCLVSERKMRELNRRFRGVDAPTDVLSFPPDDRGAPEAEPQLGDLAIAVPVAARQARSAGHSLARELRILLLHGYLHLLGYDHERDDGTMLRLQRRLERRLLPLRRSA